MPSLNLRNPLRRDPNRPTLKQRAATLKATAARLIQGKKSDPTAEALARMGPHWPGFLPYPTHAPKALLAVESVLENEAGRLLSIAHDEFARLYPLQSEGMNEPDREIVAARLRRRLRIDALTMAADPEGDAHEGDAHADLTMMTGGVVDDDGRVTFCDASGRVLHKPVADWIRFTAKRLHHQAQREMARRLNKQDLAEAERQTLAHELRRSLSTDAINILAFRPGTACDLAEAAEADAFSGPIPTPDFTGWGPVSPDLLQAMEAHREARRLMLNDPDESDERTERGVARVDVLAQAIRDVPAHSVADLRCKMVYLWPGNLEGEDVSDGLAATFASFKQDVERLAAPAPVDRRKTALVGPDPILAAIEASRAAQAAVEAWGAAIEARATPPAEADFADEDRLTEAQSETRDRVIDTVPTTPAGRLALLEWLRWQMGLYGYADGAPPDQDSYFWRFAHKSLAAALAWDGPAVVGEQEAAADAELIALAEPWDAARRFYDQRSEEQAQVDQAARAGASYPGPPPEGAGADWLDWHHRINVFREEAGINAAEGASNDALDDLAEIEDRVAAMQAHTLAGLRFKARIAERNSSIDVEWPQGLGDGMVRDLLAITGGPSGLTTPPEA